MTPPRAPAYLTSDARAEWKRVVPILAGRGTLTDGDLGLVETYVMAIGTARECARELKRDGITFLDARGTRKRHPATAIQATALQAARLAASELGLTPAARDRAKVRDKPDEDDDSPLSV